MKTIFLKEDVRSAAPSTMKTARAQLCGTMTDETVF